MNDIAKRLIERIALFDLIKAATAVTVLGTFFMIVWSLVHSAIPDNNREPLIHVLGMIDGTLMTLTAFYFGSSSSSQKKDDTIKQQVKTIADQTPPPVIEIK